MDLLLTGGTVVTMNREREVLAGADVLVQDGRVAKVTRPAPCADKTKEEQHHD